MEKFIKKVIATLLTMTMTSANLMLLGSYTISYALNSETAIINQTSETQHSNVEFNVFLEGEEHSQKLDVDSKDEKLYVNIKVKNAGYLKNGEIILQNPNLKISGIVKNDYIESVDTDSYRIRLKQINNGSDITIEIPIEILDKEQVPLHILNQETKAIFSGKYIDGSGNEKEILKEVVNKISWNSDELEVNLDTKLTKYIPYIKGEEYGVLVQVKVNSAIKDSKLPIKNTNIEILVPEFNGVRASSIYVMANNMLATNGAEDGTNFGNTNYIYDENSNVLNINVGNYNNEQGKISWIKNVNDEYLVTFIYSGKKIYDFSLQNGINTSLKVLGKITTCNDSKIEDSKELEIVQNEILGDIIDYRIEGQSEIAKGYIYANYISSTKKETDYMVKYTAVINDLNLTDKIRINQQYDVMQTAEGKDLPTTVSGVNYTYNKIVKVSEKQFTKILGTDGKIDILDENGNILGSINKGTYKDEEGNYILNISSEDNNKLSIETTKPISVGAIDFVIQKAIKGNVGYSQLEMKSIAKLKTSIDNTHLDISLIEPISKAEIEISNKDLSSIVENENVEIRATLDTSNIYNALYKNTTLKIELPSYIDKVNINNTNILMDGGLKVKNVKVEKEKGVQVINVALEGTQTEYTTKAEYKGSIVVLDTDLKVKTFTPNKTSEIKMTYTNKNEMSSNSEGTVATKVNFVAPKDVVVANGIDSNISVSDEIKTIEIKPYSEKKDVTVKGKIINNYLNPISNIVVLGKLPVKDNNKIDSNEDLGSNFDTELKTDLKLSGIDSKNYKVYYSNNENATKNLSDINNNWVEEHLKDAKSYLIVFKDYEMAAGETIDFTYNVELPENLKYDSQVYEMYKIYYTNNSLIGNIDETRISPVLKMTTGQGPDLEIELKPTVDVIRQGQIVKMNAVIKNAGDITAKNVKVNIPLPEYSTFVECIGGQGIYDENINNKVIKLGDLEAGKEQEISYYIRIDEKDIELPKEISNKLKVTFDELPDGISSNECKINVQNGDIAIELYSPVPEEKVLKRDEIIEYRMVITNISKNRTLNNAVVTVDLPKGIEYEGIVIGDELLDTVTEEGATYDSNSRKLQINLGTFDKYQYVSLKLRVGELEDSFKILAKINADGVEEGYSNVVEYKAAEVNLEISEFTSTPRYVKETEKLFYKFNIKNIGNAVATQVRIENELPEGIELEKAICTYGKSDLETSITNLIDGKVLININALESDETASIEIIAKASLLSDKNDKEIKNKILVSADGFEQVQTNEVTNFIEYNFEAHQVIEESSEGENQEEQGEGQENINKLEENRYKITGVAWIDANQDGKRDISEELLPNTTVVLLNKVDNTIVKDVDSNEEKRVITSLDGKYEFNNLKQGEYLVVFIYDASRYSLTTYQGKGIDTSYNSDVIDINMLFDGELSVVAISDVISITNGNARDIDMGVYVSEKFDLKLEKYIDKITLTTPTIGTETYNYTNKQVAKIEVLSKNVGQSSIVVEYKIVVKNEGAVAGYVKKVVDYLPQNLKFSTELNKDWYLSENGNIYNSSLENTKINPGESKELTLVASMKVTEGTLDILNNNAEIYESYSEKGLTDIDSTPGNKIAQEDDMSKADIVVSLVTGTTIKYITLIMGFMTILGLGVYGINSKVLVKKKRRRKIKL